MLLSNSSFDISSIIEKLDAITESQNLEMLREVVEDLKYQYRLAQTKEFKFDKAGILYHFTQEALVVLRGRIILDCTPMFAQISGFSCNELRGRDFVDMVHSEYVTTVLDVLQLKKGNVCQYAGYTKLNHVYYAEIHINKMFLSDDIFFVLVRDITSQKKLEEKLRESEIKFKNLANTTSVAIMIYQGDKWVYANPAGCKMSGYSFEELLNMNYWDFVHDEFRDLIKKRGQMRQQGEDSPSGYEFKIVSKSGIEKWVYLDGKLTLYNGKPAGLISIIEITGIKNVELSLKHKNIELSEAENQLQANNVQLQRLNAKLQNQNAILKMAKERAEDSDRLKSAFLANMSHEIRTPMNAIMGFAEILANSNIESDLQREFGQTIYNRSQHLLNIINDIVDISKIEANLITIHKTRFDLNEVLDALDMTFSEVLHRKNKATVNLDFQKTPAGTALNICTDKRRLEQILSNLIHNAIKFTDEGTISIRYNLRDNNILEVFISDTGIGIPSSDVNLVFDRFVMANNAVNDKHDGTGLGLAISKSLANLLGGDITIESTSSKGTVFRVFINVETFKNEQIIDKEDVSFTHSDVGEKHILIVEDDNWSANYLEIFLKGKDFHTVTAKTGENALEIMKSGQKFDLVLLDIKLPGINGLEVVAQIKAMYPSMPIIAQTAYAMNEDRQRALAAGCDEYIAKPIESSLLMNLLVKYL